ncbi:DUF2510 domain-containing protein [Nocardioides plantarum]|uniref:DUF2510 domain-containing protein n=1 Tax=Nocardioides plantarum TaxID=29299 RepID=A0ABV5KFX8_9ACTN|nr:DUF2510 domain-containing protein [Nocardioides plantarum]
MEMFDLWGQVGAYVRLDPPADKAAVQALLGSSRVGRDEPRLQACLFIDGDRLRVDVDAVVVGWVPEEITDGYLGVVRSMTARGRTPRVTARVQVYDSYEAYGNDANDEVEDEESDLASRDGLWVNAYISLAEPHLLQPLNDPPTGDVVELPEGRKQKVAVSASTRSDGARPWIRPEGAGWVYCHLKPHTEQLARSTRDVVQVWIDSTLIGTLTPAMSKNFLPLVNLVVDSGRIPVARGLVKGNHLQVEMAVAALKSSEVTQSWLRDRDLMPAHAGTSPLAAPDVLDDPIEQTTDSSGGEGGFSSRAEGAGREPGFYADPEGMADERFWDGFEWTPRIRMRPKPAR